MLASMGFILCFRYVALGGKDEEEENGISKGVLEG
jgi:hypothetical protein